MLTFNMPSKTAPTTDEGDLGLIDEDGGTRKSDMADQDLRDMAEQGKRQQFNVCQRLSDQWQLSAFVLSS